MKIQDVVKYRGPALRPAPGDGRDLALLAEALRAADFNTERLDQIWGGYRMVFGEIPGYAWRCRHDGSAAADMALLWLLHEPVARSRVEELLSPRTVELLLARGVVEPHEPHALRARVDLHPCEGRYVFTDHTVGVTRFNKHVYEPGDDSYALARMTPRTRVERALDLCTGAGLHAILAAAHSDHAVGVDINDRALDFARVNAALNGVDGVAFRNGDLYAAVSEEEPFDLIATNPPWIASPANATPELYRWGGEDGEDLTRRIVQGLPRHLSPGGTLAMFVVYPVIEGRPYLQRIREWLGEERGWGVALVTFSDIPLETFVASQIAAKWDWDAHVAEFARWMAAYERMSVTAMATGVVYARRLLYEGAWTAEHRMPLPRRSLADRLGGWLDTLERVHRPDWPRDWTPTLSPSVHHVGTVAATGEACIHFHDPAWRHDLLLEPRAARVLASLDGSAAPDPRDVDIWREFAVRDLVC